VATKHQKFKLNLSDFSPIEREAIALEVIDKIIKRTKQGKDKNGEQFKPYSKKYERSFNFKIAGKSSQVDLTLSGDMLDSIKILQNRPSEVVIGYEKGSQENGKADGNIRGTYGQSKPVGPARDFLGIEKADLQKIISRYEKPKAEERAKKRILAEKEAARLSGRVDTEDLDGES
jgi:hypothetical protein